MTGFGTQPFGTSPFGLGSGSTGTVDEASRPQVVDWQIIPRDANLGRTADPVSGWTKLTLVERLNVPDAWVIEGPPSALAAFAIPGMGCILDRDGVQITSGKVSRIFRKGEVQDGRLVETMQVGFASDLAALGWRIVFPTPAHVLTTAISTFPAAYDLRSGPVEDLLLGYIRSNLGDLAQVGRQLSRLRIPVSLGRGGTTQVSARLDNLGALTTSLAEAGNLRVTVGHVEDAGGAWLDVTVTPIADVSADIRFGSSESTSAGLLASYEYEIEDPDTTRAVVGLGGELQLREFLQRTDAPAETLWGHSVETFVDQRNVATDSVDKLAEGTREGQKALDEGAGPVRVSFVPVLGPDLEYRRDVSVGDVVGYDLPGLEPAEDKIREATTVVAVENGQPTEQVSVVVGTPDAPSTRSQSQTARALRAVTAIQRSK